MKDTPTVHMTYEEEETTMEINVVEINHYRTSSDLFEITEEEITKKVRETELENQEKKQKLIEILRKYTNLFRKQPGILTTYENSLKIKQDRSNISYTDDLKG